MSRFCIWAGAMACLAIAPFSQPARGATFNYTQNAVTYTVVEADPFISGGSPGNTVNMNNPGQFFAQNVGGNFDGLYSYRDFGALHFNAPAGKVASDRDLMEMGGQDVIAPDLRTTVTGLASGTYDVYLVMMTETLNLSSPLAPATLGANIDVGQSRPTSLRGGRSQPGLIFTGFIIGGNYEVTLAPLGSVSGTSFGVLVGPMWAGDLNRDGINNQDDLNIVLGHWGQTVAPGDRSMGNTNDDTIINQLDLNAVYYETWGEKGYPPGRRGDYLGVAYVQTSSVVPEPASLALLAIGGIALVVVRRRRSKKVAVTLSAALVALATSTGVASAAITGWFNHVTLEEGESSPAGQVSQDLTVNASTDWLATNMRIILTSGTIYQDTSAGIPAPAIVPPNPANFASFPTLRWDTYLTGSPGLATVATDLKSAGGAIDLGGATGFPNAGSFSTTSVNVNWFTTNTTDTGTFTLGRFTLSDAATGTWMLRLDSLNQAAPALLNGTIQNGLLLGTSPPAHAGDFDLDGDVDGADFVAWQTNFPKATGATRAQGDADADGDVDGADFVVWQTNFPFTPGPGASPVPEPQSMLLFAIGVALTARAWKQQRQK